MALMPDGERKAYQARQLFGFWSGTGQGHLKSTSYLPSSANMDTNALEATQQQSRTSGYRHAQSSIKLSTLSVYKRPQSYHLRRPWDTQVGRSNLRRPPPLGEVLCSNGRIRKLRKHPSGYFRQPRPLVHGQCTPPQEVQSRSPSWGSLTTGMGGVVSTLRIGDTGVKCSRIWLPRLSTPAASGIATWRRGSDLQEIETPRNPGVRVQVAARKRVRLATVTAR